MPDLTAQFPADLARRTRIVRFGGVPVLLAHPDWQSPAPVMVWMHGRTAAKEIDPGRYLRWVRAGVAACAIDLPGHGERAEARLQGPEGTLEVLERMVGEIDGVVEHLADPAWGGVFDLDRMGIGGMSAGGMAAMARACAAHEFRALAVEGSTGWLGGLYFPSGDGGVARWAVSHDPGRVARLDPMERLGGFRPVPMLVLHSEADAIVPWEVQRAFVERLRGRYAEAGADAGLIEVRTWASTGAPQEHSGFGRVASEAKTVQTEFVARVLGASAVGGGA